METILTLVVYVEKLAITNQTLLIPAYAFLSPEKDTRVELVTTFFSRTSKKLSKFVRLGQSLLELELGLEPDSSSSGSHRRDEVIYEVNYFVVEYEAAWLAFGHGIEGFREARFTWLMLCANMIILEGLHPLTLR